MDQKTTVDIFSRNMLLSSERRRINKEGEFLAELEEIDQKSAFYEDEYHTETALIASIALFVEIIVKFRLILTKPDRSTPSTRTNFTWTSSRLLLPGY